MLKDRPEVTVVMVSFHSIELMEVLPLALGEATKTIQTIYLCLADRVRR